MSDLLRDLRALLDEMELHDATGHPTDEGYADAWGRVNEWLTAREVLAIEPEYEYRAVTRVAGGSDLRWPWRPSRTLAWHEADNGATYMQTGYLERRVKAGPWERVD